jgi:hypothetical protein
VIGDGGVVVVAAGAHMRGDPLAFYKHLDSARRQPDLDLVAGEAVGDTVEMSLDHDVVIDANAAQPPFSKGVGLVGQLLEIRSIELLEQGAAGDAEPTNGPHLIELMEQLADRRIEFGQTVKAAMTQPIQQPTFDDQCRRSDFGFT